MALWKSDQEMTEWKERTAHMTIMRSIFVLGGTSMKTSTVGTHLHVARANSPVQAEKKVGGKLPTDEEARTKEQALIRRGVRAAQRWPQERNARVEQLRSLVQSGRYRIDSGAIAECLLNNVTHFV
jgi:anti-sigma28 factor (negative regulator of flagellin synthesis)